MENYEILKFWFDSQLIDNQVVKRRLESQDWAAHPVGR